MYLWRIGLCMGIIMGSIASDSSVHNSIELQTFAHHVSMMKSPLSNPLPWSLLCGKDIRGTFAWTCIISGEERKLSFDMDPDTPHSLGSKFHRWHFQDIDGSSVCSSGQHLTTEVHDKKNQQGRAIAHNSKQKCIFLASLLQLMCLAALISIHLDWTSWRVSLSLRLHRYVPLRFSRH